MALYVLWKNSNLMFYRQFALFLPKTAICSFSLLSVYYSYQLVIFSCLSHLTDLGSAGDPQHLVIPLQGLHDAADRSQGGGGGSD